MELMPKDPTEASEPFEDPWTELDPYVTIPDRITEAELEAMWNLSAKDFEIWKDNQNFKNQILIFREETRVDEQAKTASKERKARREAKRQENPNWGVWT